jgi:hypothetical protein
MTWLTFILAVVPLVVAHGAGQAGQSGSPNLWVHGSSPWQITTKPWQEIYLQPSVNPELFD